jgi:hypothetical protein
MRARERVIFNHPRRIGTATALTLTLTLLGAVQASASTFEPPNKADAVARVIADLAPAGPLADVAETPDGNFGATTNGLALSLPSDGDGAVSVGDLGLTLSLPGLDTASGALAEDGTIVYPAGASDVATAIQVQSDGVRIQTVLGSDSSPRTFKYVLGGATPVVRQDGGVDLVADTPPGTPRGISKILATVDTPWAVDGSGKDIATHYEVDGATLVQVVDVKDDTVFPVVADPKASFGFGVYFSFNKYEMQMLATAVASVGAMAAGMTCAWYGSKLSKIPVVGYMISSACTFVTGAKVFALIRSLPSLSASWYTASCYQTRVPPEQPAWHVVAYSQCKTYAQSYYW